jgi:hypothetical protein
MSMNKVKNENSTQTNRWDNIHPIAIHPITCTTHYCPISFAQKCGLVLYMWAKAKHPCITLFAIKPFNFENLRKIGIFFEKPIKVVGPLPKKEHWAFKCTHH